MTNDRNNKVLVWTQASSRAVACARTTVSPVSQINAVNSLVGLPVSQSGRTARHGTSPRSGPTRWLVSAALMPRDACDISRQSLEASRSMRMSSFPVT